jgi:hypothetical protein
MAANTEWSSSYMVTTRTPMWGLVRRIERVASMPLRPGMCRSIRITSGCSVIERDRNVLDLVGMLEHQRSTLKEDGSMHL